MSKRLPPLNALRVFDAAARHMSFALAAAELHVTPAALSFHPSNGGVRAWAHVSKTGTMRNLIEAVLGRHRADLNRFKKQGIWVYVGHFT